MHVSARIHAVGAGGAGRGEAHRLEDAGRGLQQEGVRRGQACGRGVRQPHMRLDDAFCLTLDRFNLALFMQPSSVWW